MMKALLLSLSLLVLNACTQPTDSKYLVLDYRDFGPPVLATELLGNYWWQWQPHGESRPREYDIKVVIYEPGQKDDIEKMFQVDPQNSRDFRYLSLDSAVEFLQIHIEEDAIPDVTERLRLTLEKIESHFSSDPGT